MSLKFEISLDRLMNMADAEFTSHLRESIRTHLVTHAKEIAERAAHEFADKLRTRITGARMDFDNQTLITLMIDGVEASTQETKEHAA